jgi:hypothetical protein
MTRLGAAASLALLCVVGPVGAAQAAETLHVRFADDAGNRCTPLGCRGPAGGALDAARAAGARITGCYDLPAGRLRALRALADRLSGSGAPDLTQCFSLTTETRNGTLESRLRGAPGFVSAEWATPVVPAQRPAPDFSGSQFVLEAAPTGLGVRRFWDAYGTRGEGVLFADIELGVDATHVELARHRDLLSAPGAGVPLPGIGEPFDHGVASMGIVVAADDGVGVVGIAPRAGARFFTAYPTAYQWGAGPAVLRALNTLAAGDVMLLELQRPGPAYDADRDESGQYGMVPVEWAQIDREAIELATRLGVIVIEPAGNGFQDLDAPIYGGRFSRGDSGAIVVCAGNPPTETFGPAREAMSYTNFGRRCDLQGYGADVLAPGYGDLWGAPDSADRLTAVFGGTSAASPQVAGAAVLLSGLARASGGYVPPTAMRTLLQSTGTAGDPTIGPLPDVMAAAEALPAFVVPRRVAAFTGPWAACRADAGCDAGLRCVAVSPGERYCLAACEPFDAGPSPCAPGQACFLQPWGGGVCAPEPGAGRTGEPCDSELDCAANYLCDSQIGCQPLCSVSRNVGCGARQTCLFSGDAYGDVGVCATLSPDPSGAPDTAPCVQDAECQGGFCCCFSDAGTGGQCTTPGCRDAGDCNGSGLDCVDDPAVGVPFCAVACGPGVACPTGFVCETSYCRLAAACTFDDECAPGERCVAGVCEGATPECGRDADCPPGETCVEARCRAQACANSVDCPIGTWCRARQCVSDAACDVDAACRPDERCRGDRCTPVECVRDSDCPAGRRCVDTACEVVPACAPHRIRRADGVCVPDGTCATDDDCDLHYACSGGRCRRTAACEADTDCRAGFVCAGALCVPATCSSDGDCGTGHACVEGACVRRSYDDPPRDGGVDVPDGSDGAVASDAGGTVGTDVGDAVPGGRGCACRTSAAAGGAPGLWLPVTWLALRRRRRRPGAQATGAGRAARNATT